MGTQLQEMQAINKQQKAFYEIKEGYTISPERNFLSKTWVRIRNKAHTAAADFGMYHNLYRIHREWLGDLADSNLLDLGCYSGNPLSLEIAEKSKSYLGIDLSESAIKLLDGKLKEKNVSNARAEAVDFLSDEFQQKYKGHFDVVYAHSVAHHFKHFELFLEYLANVLSPNGIVISHDPLQSSAFIRTMRLLYRPFQTDRAWEHPFTKKSIELIQEKFTIKATHGFLGKAKIAIPIYVLNKNMGTRMGKNLLEKDLIASKNIGKGLWQCLHVTMLWEKK